MGFPSQEYWTGLPFPPPGDLPDPGIEPASPAFAGRFFTTELPGKPTGNPSHNSLTEDEIKGMQIGREEVKITVVCRRHETVWKKP